MEKLVKRILEAIINEIIKPVNSNVGKLIPIIKDHSSRTCNMAKIRSITVSDVLENMDEKIAQNELLRLFTPSANQFGFRPEHSTQFSWRERRTDAGCHRTRRLTSVHLTRARRLTNWTGTSCLENLKSICIRRCTEPFTNTTRSRKPM